MTGYLADTNVPSELTRVKPEIRVAEFLKQAGRDRVYLSVLTLGEICKGIRELPISAKRTNLQTWLDSVMRPWFEGRILPVTAPIAERWGFLAAEAKAAGSPLAVVDGLLAATALEHNLTLVTRNARDFVGRGVTVLNPWETP